MNTHINLLSLTTGLGKFHYIHYYIIQFEQVRKEVQAVSKELDYPESNLSTLRPLCPTRWLCRLKPVQATVDNYHPLLKAFSTLACSDKLSGAEAKSKAQRIFKNLAKAETFLGLCLMVKPLALLEQFSITLQAEKMDFDSVEESVKKIEDLLQKYRDSEFQKHFEAAVKLPFLKSLFLLSKTIDCSIISLSTESLSRSRNVLVQMVLILISLHTMLWQAF